MKTLLLTKQFKKDFKKLEGFPDKIKLIIKVLDDLQNGKTLPKELKPHPLKGNYKNHMECHIQNDLLLIWFDKEKDVIKAVRVGSHSELFD